MVSILVCDCKDCTHWEIVRDAEGNIHLLCKTCGRTDRVTLVLSADQPARWVDREKE